MAVTSIPDAHFASLSKLEAGYWWFLARVNWARRLVAPWKNKQGDRIVYADLGCGTGGFARSLDESFSFSKVMLVDSDPNALKRIDFPKARVVAADLAPALQLPERPNLITMMDVIEHVPDDQALVRTAAGLLPPGGLLVISVPAHPVLFSSWDTMLGHQRRYTRRQLVAVMEQAGLRVRSVRAMWSFLFLPAFIRKFENRTAENMEFPPVSPWMNALLVQFSNLEWSLPPFLRLPFGTSWIIAAEKI